jgi:hypothetical protein
MKKECIHARHTPPIGCPSAETRATEHRPLDVTEHGLCIAQQLIKLRTLIKCINMIRYFDYGFTPLQVFDLDW